MKALGIEIDRYATLARALPMFITVAPIATVVAAWTPGVFSLVTGAIGAVVLGGASFFLGQVARSAGKAREAELWTSWDGPPSVRFLRHRDTQFNRHVRERCHAELEKLGQNIPTPSAEADNPAAADEVYGACTKLLIGLTRDLSKYPLLLKENVNYGFHRNLWSLKSAGFVLALLGLSACGGRLWLTWSEKGTLDEPALAGAGVNVCLLLAWAFWVSRDNIKLAAEAYAERLLEACASRGATGNQEQPAAKEGDDALD